MVNTGLPAKKLENLYIEMSQVMGTENNNILFFNSYFMNTPANTNAQETLFDELRHLLNDTGVSNETLLTEVKKAHSFIEASKLTA